MSLNRRTPRRSGDLVSMPVAADTVIADGALVVAKAGYAAPGERAEGLAYLGRADQRADNFEGAAGALTVLIRRTGTFRWQNAPGADAVTLADLGATAYIFDDRTVTRTAAGASPAGMILGVDGHGVWVDGGVSASSPGGGGGNLEPIGTFEGDLAADIHTDAGFDWPVGDDFVAWETNDGGTLYWAYGPSIYGNPGITAAAVGDVAAAANRLRAAESIGGDIGQNFFVGRTAGNRALISSNTDSAGVTVRFFRYAGGVSLASRRTDAEIQALIDATPLSQLQGEVADSQIPAAIMRDAELTAAAVRGLLGLTAQEVDDLLTGATIAGQVITIEQNDGTTITLTVPAGAGGMADGVISSGAFNAAGTELTLTLTEGDPVVVSVPALLRGSGTSSGSAITHVPGADFDDPAGKTIDALYGDGEASNRRLGYLRAHSGSEAIFRFGHSIYDQAGHRESKWSFNHGSVEPRAINSALEEIYSPETPAATRGTVHVVVDRTDDASREAWEVNGALPVTLELVITDFSDDSITIVALPNADDDVQPGLRVYSSAADAYRFNVSHRYGIIFTLPDASTVALHSGTYVSRLVDRNALEDTIAILTHALQIVPDGPDTAVSGFHLAGTDYRLRYAYAGVFNPFRVAGYTQGTYVEANVGELDNSPVGLYFATQDFAGYDQVNQIIEPHNEIGWLRLDDEVRVFDPDPDAPRTWEFFPASFIRHGTQLYFYSGANLDAVGNDVTTLAGRTGYILLTGALIYDARSGFPSLGTDEVPDDALAVTDHGLYRVDVDRRAQTDPTGDWAAYAAMGYRGAHRFDPADPLEGETYYDSRHYLWRIGTLYTPHGSPFTEVEWRDGGVPAGALNAHFPSRARALHHANIADGAIVWTGSAVEVLSNFVAGENGYVHRRWFRVGASGQTDADQVITETTEFGGNVLRNTEDNVQAALERLDDVLAGSTGAQGALAGRVVATYDIAGTAPALVETTVGGSSTVPRDELDATDPEFELDPDLPADYGYAVSGAADASSKLAVPHVRPADEPGLLGHLVEMWVFPWAGRLDADIDAAATDIVLDSTLIDVTRVAAIAVGDTLRLGGAEEAVVDGVPADGAAGEAARTLSVVRGAAATAHSAEDAVQVGTARVKLGDDLIPWGAGSAQQAGSERRHSVSLPTGLPANASGRPAIDIKQRYFRPTNTNASISDIQLLSPGGSAQFSPDTRLIIRMAVVNQVIGTPGGQQSPGGVANLTPDIAQLTYYRYPDFAGATPADPTVSWRFDDGWLNGISAESDGWWATRAAALEQGMLNPDFDADTFDLHVATAQFIRSVVGGVYQYVDGAWDVEIEWGPEYSIDASSWHEAHAVGDNWRRLRLPDGGYDQPVYIGSAVFGNEWEPILTAHEFALSSDPDVYPENLNLSPYVELLIEIQGYQLGAGFSPWQGAQLRRPGAHWPTAEKDGGNDNDNANSRAAGVIYHHADGLNIYWHTHYEPHIDPVTTGGNDLPIVFGFRFKFLSPSGDGVDNDSDITHIRFFDSGGAGYEFHLRIFGRRQ